MKKVTPQSNITRRDAMRSAIGAVSLTALPVASLGVTANAVLAQQMPAQQTAAIAKDAYIFCYPLVMNYRTMYAQAIAGDRTFGKWVHLGVSSPTDKDIVTPNNDTPYSYAWVDLRAEPWVLTLPKIEKERFFTSQWDDYWAYVLDNPGSVVDGNDGVSVLLVSPSWKGELPAGIKRIVRGESDLLGSLTRTQLIGGKEDLLRVKEIQRGYQLQPLSKYFGTQAPAGAPKVNWPAWIEGDETTEKFWSYVQFLLPFTTPNPADSNMYARMASIGIKPGAAWEPGKLDPATRESLKKGQADALAEMKKRSEGGIDAAKFFGDRARIGTDYFNRAMGVYMGIFGNVQEVSIYLSIPDDSQGRLLDRKQSLLHAQLPQGPAAPGQVLLVRHDVFASRSLSGCQSDRPLFDRKQPPGLSTNDDGSLTFYFAVKSPGADKESNWLPAPSGPFWMVLRCYGPSKEVVDGTWKNPKPVAAT